MTYLERELRAVGASETALALRRWRRAMRLTQTEVAALIGVHHDTVRMVECGRRTPRDRTFNAYRALVDGWDESMRPPRRPDRRGMYPRTERHRRSRARVTCESRRH